MKDLSITIVQITDFHLLEDDGKKIFGHHPNSRFRDAMLWLKEREYADLILVTGDVSDDGTRSSYQRAVKELRDLETPVCWLWGNHDDPKTMVDVFEKLPGFRKLRKVEVGKLRILGLDTCVKGEAYGQISVESLDFLETELQSAQKIPCPIVVVMHHHPVMSGTPCIDEYILKNNSDLWHLMDRYRPVKLIICGHVHGDYSVLRGETRVEMAPALCFQWVKGARSLATEASTGYKVYRFCADGQFTVQARWISMNE